MNKRAFSSSSFDEVVVPVPAPAPAHVALATPEGIDVASR